MSKKKFFNIFFLLVSSLKKCSTINFLVNVRHIDGCSCSEQLVRVGPKAGFRSDTLHSQGQFLSLYRAILHTAKWHFRVYSIPVTQSLYSDLKRTYQITDISRNTSIGCFFIQQTDGIIGMLSKVQYREFKNGRGQKCAQIVCTLVNYEPVQCQKTKHCTWWTIWMTVLGIP